MRNTIFGLLAVIAIPGAALAQSASAPTMGWIPADDPGRYQDVLGIPGSSRLSPARALGPALRLLAIRPGSSRQLAAGPSGAAGLVDLGAGSPDGFEPLPDGVAPDLAAWSPAGRALLLSTSAGGRTQIWKETGRGLALAWDLPQAAPQAAVSDDGALLLLPAGGLLALYGEDGSSSIVGRSPGAPFTFLQGCRCFAFLEEAALVIRTPGSELARVDLPPPPEEGARLLASPAPGRLLVADSSPASSSTTLRLFSGQGEPLGEWRCPSLTSAIRATGAPGLLHLVSPGPGALWLADFSGQEPRVFFVPPRPEAPAEGGDR